MGTLPPKPTYNAEIPVITSAGGTATAYNDPSSPESIMKQTTLLHAQTLVDTSYDVDLKAEKKKEGFSNHSSLTYVLYFFVFLLLITLVRLKRRTGKIYILFLASALFIISILYK
jgi:hypothetical protein